MWVESPPAVQIHYIMIQKIEDIYPCTIVNRRFGGVAIVNADAFCGCVDELQGNEEWHYGDNAQRGMESGYSWIAYGLGETLDEAFKDFLKNKKRVDEEKEEFKRNPPPMTEAQKEFIEKTAQSLSEAFSRNTSPLIPAQPLSGPSGLIFYLDHQYGMKSYSGDTCCI